MTPALCSRVDAIPFLMFSQLAFLYYGILRGFCIFFLVAMSIKARLSPVSKPRHIYIYRQYTNIVYLTDDDGNNK
jgi:hypothetical protein